MTHEKSKVNDTGRRILRGKKEVCQKPDFKLKITELSEILSEIERCDKCVWIIYAVSINFFDKGKLWYLCYDSGC